MASKISGMEGPIRCLLIDDDEDDQEIFLMTLSAINGSITCETANNGVDGLLLLEPDKQAPDYIFVDMNMPKMNGLDCLKNIKSRAHLNQTRVFMFSTTAEPSMVAKCMELGVDEFIVKPASTVALREKLAEIFGLIH